MIILLHIMIIAWSFCFILSILSGYYITAILCLVFLLNAISDLYREKERLDVMQSIELAEKYINEWSKKEEQ